MKDMKLCIIFEDEIDKASKIIENEVHKNHPVCEEYKIKTNVFGQTMLVLRNNKSNIMEVPFDLIKNIINAGLTLAIVIANYDTL
jgi:hypothetical protein